MPTELTADTRSELAPRGRLRVALNHGNFVLVGRDAEGRAHGISVDLARNFAARHGFEIDFVEFERAGDVAGSAQDDVWDMCFLAPDPAREATIAFTPPYIRIFGNYLAGPDCPVKGSAELVDARLPVGSVRGSAYTLTLQRQAVRDALVLFEDLDAAIRALAAGEVQAVAGIREAMAQEALSLPGARLLEPPFMEIRQAMAVPQGRPAAHAAVVAHLRDLSRADRIAEILERNGVDRSCALAVD